MHSFIRRVGVIGDKDKPSRLVIYEVGDYSEENLLSFKFNGDTEYHRVGYSSRAVVQETGEEGRDILQFSFESTFLHPEKM